MDNAVSHPKHYTHLPVECIDVAEHFNFNIGNAIKYLWRHELKDNPVQDLEKALWYVQRELNRYRDVSSVVERGTPNACVGGSIPSRPANKST